LHRSHLTEGIPTNNSGHVVLQKTLVNDFLRILFI
jgi:hypothetical protein